MNNNLPPEIEKKVQQWLKDPYDKKTQHDVQALINNDLKNLIDAFYTNINFGTGGMRGLMGVGTNRINRYTIANATQGLANYILSKQFSHPSVFISYDSRINSQFFAEETARVLGGNGIKVYLTKTLRPTPFVSFGCRRYSTTAAVMITASHNPSEYNGYKVYWSDGGQIVPPHDIEIMEEIKKIEHPNQVKFVSLTDPHIYFVGTEDDKAYYDTINSLQNFPQDNTHLGHQLKIIYSPLHGSGITMIPEALKHWGFTSISYVEEQKTPDGSFPTVKLPNPEQKDALIKGINLLKKEKGDLFIATDPDADRMGLVVMHEKTPVIINGNQIASLCIYYLCHILKEQGKMPENGAFITTIVTTELFSLIAKSFNKKCFEVLTGFKYIGEKIHEWEQSQEYKFIFGAEESLGFLYGTHSRDKDAITASCLIAEIALYQKKKKKTLIDLLNEIYKQFGPFKEKQLSISFDGESKGAEKMERLMGNIRQNPPKKMGNQKITIIEDYLISEKIHIDTKQKEKLNLPRSNILVFRLEDKSKYIIRPSGTEPKLKIYGLSRSEDIKNLEDSLNSLKTLYFS